MLAHQKLHSLGYIEIAYQKRILHKIVYIGFIFLFSLNSLYIWNPASVINMAALYIELLNVDTAVVDTLLLGYRQFVVKNQRRYKGNAYFL